MYKTEIKKNIFINRLLSKIWNKILFGEPGYYPKFGFKTCDNYGITTADSKNFDAFMGKELIEDGLEGVHGKFFEGAIFDNINKKEVEEFDKHFPYMEKKVLSGQWGREI